MDLGRLFKKSKESVESDTLTTLRQVRSFDSLKEGSLKDLAEVMHFRDYRAKEYLYHEDDPGLGLYILQTGSVRLSKLDEDGDSYELGLLSENAMFGADSLFGDRKRFETAQVMTDSRLIGFFKPDLDTLLRRLPELGASVVLAIAGQIAEKQDLLMNRVVHLDNGRQIAESIYKLD